MQYKPMSVFERSAYAEKLRKDAAALIAEAERIEVGVNADIEFMHTGIKRALANLKVPDEGDTK